MTTLPIQIQTLFRKEDDASDDATGRNMSALVRNALARGRAPGSAVVLRGGRIDIIPMGPLIRNRVHIGAFLGGLTRSEMADAGRVDVVGIIGRFKWRRNNEGPGLSVAMVFLEWPDGRWWHWRAIIDEEGEAVLPDTETVHRAEDGLPKPRSLGGWWSLGRRRKLNVTLSPREAPEPKPVGAVH